MSGLSTALNEITLVLFTSLAPSGALAYVLMALPLIVRGGALGQDVRRRLDRFLCVPVIVAMVGLVASATHLGNPANALYVITGFGRSPLSNEVVCGAVFLGAAGIFWLTSFSEGREHLLVRRVAVAIISLLGLVFVGVISFAYDVGTIITWDSPLAPVTTWLNALTGGPLLAIFGMRLARFYTDGHRYGRALLVFGCVAFAVSIFVYAFWGLSLPGLRNAIASASELAPLFVPSIVLFAVIGVLAFFLGIRTVAWEGEAPLWLPVLSTAFMLGGIFLMRFQFYMIHLTAGVGI